MSTFVLVHGAFRGGWYWRGVAERLRAAHHAVFAPSLTGAGDRAHLAGATVTLSTWIDDVAALITSWDLRDVVLVGHSFGGVIVVGAAERVAPRLSRLCFLDAAVPSDGERAVDLSPPAVREAYPLPPPGTIIPPRAIEADTNLDAPAARWATERLTPVPIDPSLEPLPVRDPAAAALPRSYVFFRDTPDFFPAAWTRQRLDADGVGYRMLPGGHDAPLATPGPVADVLMEGN